MPSLPSRSFPDFGESLESAPRERTVFESKPDEDYEKYDDSPVLINNQTQYSKAEEVEESLSLEEKTKELILKALKKHKGRRKDAADELGISERTLYRKIKEYDIAI